MLCVLPIFGMVLLCLTSTSVKIKSSHRLKHDACAWAGLLGLIDELTAGTLIAPAGLPLNPTPEAVAWAEDGAELVPVEAWPVLGVPGASTDTALVRGQGALCCWLPAMQVKAVECTARHVQRPQGSLNSCCTTRVTPHLLPELFLASR